VLDQSGEPDTSIAQAALSEKYDDGEDIDPPPERQGAVDEFLAADLNAFDQQGERTPGLRYSLLLHDLQEPQHAFLQRLGRLSQDGHVHWRR
jgi:hypothetical protein